MVKMIDMTSALKQVREGLNKDDEKTIKPIIKQKINRAIRKC